MNNRRKRTLRNRRLAYYKGIGLSVAAFVCIMFSVVLFSNFGEVEASNGISREKQYVSIEIESGDTVWSLAENHRTSEYKSTKELAEEILEINGIHENTVLKPGNKLIVPEFVDVASH